MGNHKMDGVIPLSMTASTQEMVSQLGSGFTVKGVVTEANLPDSGTLGDLYIVSDKGYASYIWDGSAWQEQAGDVATNANIDSALYS